MPRDSTYCSHKPECIVTTNPGRSVLIPYFIYPPIFQGWSGHLVFYLLGKFLMVSVYESKKKPVLICLIKWIFLHSWI